MNIDINFDDIDHEDLIALYRKTSDFIAYLDSEIETREVEKK